MNIATVMNHIPRMDKWEIPNLQTIRFIKPSILEESYLVTGLH